MKVIGVGLNKTGTKTLGVCLRHWGFNHVTLDEKAFELWRRRENGYLINLMADYDSFEDWPWPLIYREADKAFPDSKFILTKRKDANTWFESLCKHAELYGPSSYRKYIYGYEMPHDHRCEHIKYYMAHNEAVREYFTNRPNTLLEVCWELGDGWKELAEFFSFDDPMIPFPHANKRPSRFRVLISRFIDVIRM